MDNQTLDKLNTSLCVIIDRLEDTVKPEIIELLREVATELYQASEREV